MRLVAGLGNPGEKYKNTRHNIGFMVLDELSRRFGVAWKSGFKGEYAFVTDGDRSFYLLKPVTYMNLSGESVSELARYYKIAPEEIMVVQDELDFEYGRLKFRNEGSSGGHNGINSVIQHLSTDSFVRLRMGVSGTSRANIRGYTAEYVLSTFTPVEKETLGSFIAKGADAAVYCIKYGLTKAMNEYNK